MRLSLQVLLLSYGALFLNLASAAAGEMFDAPVLYPVGAHPYSVTAQDVDQDGHPDIATADRYSHAVSVLINNGDGTFQPRATYAVVGSDPLSVAGGDFNADGYPDLAVASHYSNAVSVLINNGDGTFAAAVGYPVGTQQLSVTAADFSRDGYPDLAVTLLYAHTVSILTNNGDGTFGAPVSYPVGTHPMFSDAADLNADGNPDLAVANGSSCTMSVLINNGDGTFAAAVHYATGSFPRSVSAGDFNHDGDFDLAVANSNSDTVFVFFNNGDGTFSPPTNYSVEPNPSFTTLGDFDADGYLDVAAVSYASASLSVLVNNGDGTFAAAANSAIGGSPMFVTASDLDSDGKMDLAVTNYANPGTVGILFNRWANTQPGENVIVTDPETGTSLKFDLVTTAGETTVTMTDVGGGGIPGPPEGFRVMPEGWYYDISTTAVFEGYVTIAIEYDDTGLTLREEENLSLWQSSGGWNRVPAEVDTENNIIYAETDHLSYFLVTSGMTATADIHPGTLNLKSKGQYITCYLELPPAYEPSTVDLSTVSVFREGFSGTVAEFTPTAVGDYDNDGIADLMIKFSRSDVYAMFPPPDLGSIALEIDGSLTIAGQPYFSATVVVDVIDRGKDHANEADPSSVQY